MLAAHHIPGIRVDTDPPARAGDRFPRMDVAVFVGIAARGPCHRPVLVDSPAAFEAVFGGAVPLAQEQAGGIMLSAHLGASVRAFFSNGGVRCWVIRIGWTGPLLQAWRENGHALPDGVIMATNRNPLFGVLGRIPRLSTGESRVQTAELEAASAGAWSDGLAVSARVARAPIAIHAPEAHRWGLSFRSTASLAVGDLIELREYDARILRYAKIVHREDNRCWAAWSGSFLDITGETPVKIGHARLTNRRNRVAAQFHEGRTSRVVLDQPYPQLVAGSWVLFFQQGEALWLRADRVEGAEALGPAWQQVGSRLPETPFVASRLSIDLRTETGGATRIDSDLALTPEAPRSLFAMVGDAVHYAADPSRIAMARPHCAVPADLGADLAAARGRHAGAISPEELARAFVAGAVLPAQRPFLRASFLPLGLETDFGPASLPYPPVGERRALERSGLVPFDHRLFVDPAFSGQPVRAIDALAVQRHDLENRPLFGIHAAYDIPEDSVGDASILCAPDAAQPGWSLREDTTALPDPVPGVFTPPNWHDHTGPCLIADQQALGAPDFAGFLDSTVTVLATPRLGAPRGPSRDGSFRLGFATSDNNTVFVLEEAARHDFADAAEIWRGTDAGLTLTGRSEGAHYYRLRTERDGNVSPYAARRGVVRTTDYVALPDDPDALLRIHVAMLRLAAGSAAMTALLSLPRTFRAAEARGYAARLVTPGFGDTAITGQEERALSYGALFHPWIVGGSQDALLAAPAEGAVAGAMASLARERGTWLAAANRDLANVVALYPAIPREDWPGADLARINLLLPRPRGFITHAARSLSGEPEWGQINVRRLMIMLRRMVLSLGRIFVFELNGPTVRRAIERELTNHLDILQRRGAFAGRVSRESYFIRLRDGAQDRDAGRIIAEIGIAPSRPLEFVRIALVQQGERLTLEEAR